MACDGLKKGRTVGCILADRSDLVQGGRVSHKAETGNCSVCRFDSGNAAVGARLTDGSAGIRAESREALTGCDRRTGAAGGTARNMFRIPRVLCNRECGSLGGTSHSELIHVCLSEDHHAGICDSCDRRRIVERDKVFKDL